MDAETAELVLYAITAVGAVAWLAGLRFLVVSYRMRRPAQPETFDGNLSPRANTILGRAEVEGQPADLAAKAAATFAKEGAGSFGQVKVLQRTDRLVTFEGTGPGAAIGGPGLRVGRGELAFHSAAGNRTQIVYSVEVPSGQGLLLGGVIFQILGLIVLAAGFLVIRTYVVPNQDPAIRGQTFQMFQAAHFLWPSFLFGALYRRGYRAVAAGFDALVHNLPYRDG